MGLLLTLQGQQNDWFSILVLIVAFSIGITSVATALRPGLRSIPGPVVARFSSLYRPWKISKGDAPDFYRNLHKKYGPIVRTGPNTVDISDPKALPIIYGISSKFVKVSPSFSKKARFTKLISCLSLHFTMFSIHSSKTKSCRACSP